MARLKYNQGLKKKGSVFLQTLFSENVNEYFFISPCSKQALRG